MRARPSFAVLSLSLAFPFAAAAETLSGVCTTDSAAPGLAAVSLAVTSASAVLDSAPSPSNFTAAWTDAFAAAVRGAAGTDGRLSRAEADRLASSSLYGDNAVNWLEKKGQASVDVDKLIREAAQYTFANGKRVAGQDGRISLADAKKLPKDLQDDYLSLRGKLVAKSPRAAVEAVAKDLFYLSEGDARLAFVESAAPVAGVIDAQAIRAALGAQHDARMTDGSVWFSPDPGYMKIADRTPEVRDVDAFLARLTEIGDPNDPASAVEAAKFQALVGVLKANLTDIKVIRFNQSNDPNHDAITSSIFIVGRTADGKLAGVLTGAIET